MLFTSILFTSFLGQIIVNEPESLRMAKMKYHIVKVTMTETAPGEFGVPTEKHICSGTANIEVLSWNGPERARFFAAPTNASSKSSTIECDTMIQTPEGLKFLQLSLHGNMGVWRSPLESDSVKTYYAQMSSSTWNTETNKFDQEPTQVVANTVDNLELRSLLGFLTSPGVPLIDMSNGNEVLMATVEFIDDAQ